MQVSVWGLSLIAALAPCSPSLLSGTHVNAASFERPSTTIAKKADSIVVDNFAGDRPFTTTSSAYDAKTLKLLSTHQVANCCGFYWEASATKNPDGTFDVRLHATWSNANGTRESDDRNPHLQLTGDLAVSDVALVPWIYNQTHAHQMDRIVLNPIGIETFAVAEAPSQTPPSDVAPTDRALQLVRPNGSTVTVWYDPCTFAVDSGAWPFWSPPAN